MNSANKFVEDLCYKTEQKNRTVVGGSCERQRLLRSIWLFEMGDREYINNSVNKNKSQ